MIICGYFGVHFCDFSPISPFRFPDFLVLSSYFLVYILRVLMAENLTFVVFSFVLHFDIHIFRCYMSFGVTFVVFHLLVLGINPDASLWALSF